MVPVYSYLICHEQRIGIYTSVQFIVPNYWGQDYLGQNLHHGSLSYIYSLEEKNHDYLNKMIVTMKFYLFPMKLDSILK